MSEPLLALEDAHFGYRPDRPVLAGCNLQLGRHQRIGVTGPNGSGKTTLLWLAVGLLKPQSGRIFAFGKPRETESDFYEVRCRAGLLFQDADDQLFCPTVIEDVAFGPLNLGKSRGQVRQIVSETLDRLGLAGYEDRITYKLSGGEKRLVALATVLAMQPEVLLLDEPTVGLDEDARRRVIDIVAGLPQAMLIVSHDHEMLEKVATNRLCLHDGKLVGDARFGG